MFIILGTYTPITMKGTIMVDGILASCYATVDHDLAHLGMTPLRMFHWMVEQIYGDNNGFQEFAAIAEQIKVLIPHQ